MRDNDEHGGRRHRDTPARRRQEHDDTFSTPTIRSGRLTEHEKLLLALAEESDAAPDVPDGADRYSTWDRALHGPEPVPSWVVTALAAVDSDLGVLKTGKEADVHLLWRGIPDGERHSLLAAKRYRTAEHRTFHRDSGYLEGRRMRRSREMRAMERRSGFGRSLIAEQWSAAEFATLGRLWSLGASVPYPVQRDGTEILMEFIGEDDGTAAPRLEQLRPKPDELANLWHQLGELLRLLASDGLTHGDLSAYNVLVHDGTLVLIDLPQVVDVVSNPGGWQYLERDVSRIAEWFARRGLPDADEEVGTLLGELVAAVTG